MTPLTTVLIGTIILSLVIAISLAAALVGSLAKQRTLEGQNKRLSDENNDLHGEIVALRREIHVLTPRRDSKGQYVTKPKHDSANDPVVQERLNG